MITSETKIDSAHLDYIPTHVDFEMAKELFKFSIDDCTAAVLQGADDSGFLYWQDNLANEWVEHYPTVGGAIARLSILQACGEYAWEKSFMQTAAEFVNEYSKFLHSTTHDTKTNYI